MLAKGVSEVNQKIPSPQDRALGRDHMCKVGALQEQSHELGRPAYGLRSRHQILFSPKCLNFIFQFYHIAWSEQIKDYVGLICMLSENANSLRWFWCYSYLRANHLITRHSFWWYQGILIKTSEGLHIIVSTLKTTGREGFAIKKQKSRETWNY